MRLHLYFFVRKNRGSNLCIPTGAREERKPKGEGKAESC